MSILRFHLDKDCQAAALGAALREHGIDTTTTNEVGKLGVDDDGQLQHATDPRSGECSYSVQNHPRSGERSYSE